MVPKPGLEYISMADLTLWKEADVRKSETRNEMSDLVSSMRKNGLLVPLLVNGPTADGEYLVFGGQRRLMACALAGLKKVPCLVYPNISLREAQVLSLSENLYGSKMAHNDVTNATSDLLKQYKSCAAAAKAMGVSESLVKRYAGYESMPDELKRLVGERKLSASQAMVIHTKFSDQIKAIQIAKEMGRIKDEKEKNKYYAAVRYSEPGANLKEIRDMAAKMRRFENITVSLPPMQSDSIKRLATKRMKKPGQIIADLLEKSVQE